MSLIDITDAGFRHWGHQSSRRSHLSTSYIPQFVRLFAELLASSALTFNGLMSCTNSTQNSGSNITVAATRLSHADSSDYALLQVMSQ